jgi:sporulation protein YlmC with PRC-barrel domain
MKFFYLLTAFLLCFNMVSAITGTSSNYSVSMYGNDLISGNANSNSYSATFLSQHSGTTSNSQSSSFMSNIGFFESNYFTTVSINSYSISPKSAVIGSTIGLRVDANNAQSVWVEITAPNSQTQTLNLVNGQMFNYLPVPSIIGRYNLVFYANSSTGAVASVVDHFDLTEQVQTIQPSSGSGGGGSGGSIQSCTYNWDCTPWSLCNEGKQTRTCVNIGTCNGNESKPATTNACSESLFDITLDLDDLTLQNGKMRFTLDLIEQYGLELIDVHLKYSIINTENEEVFSQIETKAIQGSLSIGKELLVDLEDGNYKLRVDVLYGNLQRAFAEQSFAVENGNIQTSNNLITGNVVTDYLNSRRTTFSVILLVISSIILLGGYYYSFSKKTSLDNSLSNVIGRDVYTNTGMKLGKSYDLIVHDNKIHGIAVLIDKGVPVPHEKVMIRYEYIKNINDVIVVDSSVLEHHSPTQST